jgi:multimeric flavodoxin WrbA
MKILAIIGSTRKGNSYETTQLIEEKMKKKGNVDFEYLFLKDLGFGQCTGCHNCVIRGEENCLQRESVAKVEEKMLEADGVIFVSPIYTFHITALMKGFVDHFTYCVHRPRFFGKKAMIFVQRGGMFKEALNYMAKVATSWGFSVACKLGVPDLDSLTDSFRNKCLKEIYAASDKFYNSIKEGKTEKPSLNRLIWFRVWKLNAVACKESIPADYKYWQEKGWLSSEYYYDTKIGWHKKAVVNVVEKLIKLFMRKTFVGY